ncbi:unnamed protein product [Rhizophagus irregularis]|nr:unnamed protein product [Rhizophagus irregularis]
MHFSLWQILIVVFQAKKVPTEPLTKPASVHNRTCGFTNGSFLTVTNSGFSLSSRSSHIVTIRMNSKGHILIDGSQLCLFKLQ